MKVFEEPQAQPAQQQGHSIILCHPNELKAALHQAGLHLPAHAFENSRHPARYEVYGDCECFFFRDPMEESNRANTWVTVFFNSTKLVIAHHGDADVNALYKALEKNLVKRRVDAALDALFHTVLSGEEDLENLETELFELERSVMQDNPVDCTPEIMRIQKLLMAMNRNFNGLLRILESLEENQNGFLPKESLRAFHLYANRATHFSDTIKSLREYATQVREAYQNQLDISMNRTMQFFTVITAIFLPLTLLTGWYGMNLSMPEYGLAWMYPAVAVASVVIVAVLLVYFKKKKWY